MPFCPNCGNRLENQVKFCPECGTAITPPEQQAATAAPPCEQPPEPAAKAPEDYAVGTENNSGEIITVIPEPTENSSRNGTVSPDNKSFVKKMLLIVGGVVFALLVICGILATVAATHPSPATFPEDPYENFEEQFDEDIWDDYFDEDTDMDDF